MKQSTTNNVGGHKITVAIIDADKVDPTSWPALAGNSSYEEEATFATGDITAKVGEKWSKIECETEMIGSTLSSEGSPGSPNMVAAPKIRFNNFGAAEMGILKHFQGGKQVIMALTTLNGGTWIYGSPELPCKTSELSGDFGAAAGDDKFAEMTFRCIDVPTLYDGTISYETVVA